MEATLSTLKPQPSLDRDVRLDLFRGLALLCLLIDHIPGGYLSRLTLKNFGFSDAAEAFVFIAGITSAKAYATRSYGIETKRIFKRILSIYLAQIALISCTAAILIVAYSITHDPRFARAEALAPFLNDFGGTLLRLALMDLQPEYFDILPLYVVMLCWLVPFLRIARVSAGAALALSFAVWLAANIVNLNIPGYRNGGWYFNPFAWQLLFCTGVVVGVGTRRDAFKAFVSSRVVIAVSLVYVAIAFAAMRPWTLLPMVIGRDLHLLPPDMFGALNKSNLSLWRMVHILALAVLISAAVPRASSWIYESPLLRFLISIGRAPLASFVTASLCSAIGTVVLLDEAKTVANNLVVVVTALAVLWLVVTPLPYCRLRPVLDLPMRWLVPHRTALTSQVQLISLALSASTTITVMMLVMSS